jgi:hypothetical protein
LDPTRIEPARIREIAVSRWWNGADLSAPMHTTDNQELSIVYRGSWSHGLGPDFQKALIDFGGGHLASGSIEIHLSTSAWREHGHDRDPRFNDTILHVVLEHDGTETRRSDGRVVPVAIIEPDRELLVALQGIEIDWNLVGGEVCAEIVTREEPDAVRAALWQLGDERLGAKVIQLSARLELDTPADILFELVMDGLGYTSNREPMRQLARRIPVSLIDSLLALVDQESRFELALGILLGTGGFLPLTPSEAETAKIAPLALTRIEAYWQTYGSAWHQDRLAPTSWERVRIRPANHPLVRLSMAAALLASSFEGFTAAIVDCVRSGNDPVTFLIDRSRFAVHAGMGEGRAIAITASGVLPFLLALADATDDPQLSEMASRRWEILDAGEPNQVTRRALRQVSGKTRLSKIGERGMQGLIQLDRMYCEPRRCHECSIAHLALSRQPVVEAATIK